MAGLRRPAPVDPQVTVPELILAGEPLPVEITLAEPGRHRIRISVTDETDRLVEPEPAVARPPSSYFACAVPRLTRVQSGQQPGTDDLSGR